jgi:hypothetical protein
MVGITLSPEQIRAAPPEVRRWLEHELAVSLGLNPPARVGSGQTRIREGWTRMGAAQPDRMTIQMRVETIRLRCGEVPR